MFLDTHHNMLPFCNFFFGLYHFKEIQNVGIVNSSLIILSGIYCEQLFG